MHVHILALTYVHACMHMYMYLHVYIHACILYTYLFSSHYHLQLSTCTCTCLPEKYTYMYIDALVHKELYGYCTNNCNRASPLLSLSLPPLLSHPPSLLRYKWRVSPLRPPPGWLGQAEWLGYPRCRLFVVEVLHLLLIV